MKMRFGLVGFLNLPPHPSAHTRMSIVLMKISDDFAKVKHENENCYWVIDGTECG